MPHIRYSFRHRDRRFRQPSEIGHDYFGTPGHDAGITGHTYLESAVTLRRNTHLDPIMLNVLPGWQVQQLESVIASTYRKLPSGVFVLKDR